MRLTVSRLRPARCASSLLLSPAASRTRGQPHQVATERARGYPSGRYLGSSPPFPEDGSGALKFRTGDAVDILGHLARQGDDRGAAAPDQSANLSMAEPGFGAQQVHGQFPGVTDRARPRRAEQGGDGHPGEFRYRGEDTIGAGAQEDRLDAHEQGS
jgi:hypothetical protein